MIWHSYTDSCHNTVNTHFHFGQNIPICSLQEPRGVGPATPDALLLGVHGQPAVGGDLRRDGQGRGDELRDQPPDGAVVLRPGEQRQPRVGFAGTVKMSD